MYKLQLIHNLQEFYFAFAWKYKLDSQILSQWAAIDSFLQDKM